MSKTVKLKSASASSISIDGELFVGKDGVFEMPDEAAAIALAAGFQYADAAVEAKPEAPKAPKAPKKPAA